MTWLGGRPGDLWTPAPGSAPRGELAASDEDTAKIFQWSVIKRLLAYVLPYKRRAVMGVVAMVVLTVVRELAQPLLQGAAIDRIVAGEREPLFIICAIYLGTMVIT